MKRKRTSTNSTLRNTEDFHHFLLTCLSDMVGVPLPSSGSEKKNFFSAISKDTRKYGYMCYYTEVAIRNQVITNDVFLLLRNKVADIHMGLDKAIDQLETSYILPRRSEAKLTYKDKVNFIMLRAFVGRIESYVDYFHSHLVLPDLP